MHLQLSLNKTLSKLIIIFIIVNLLYNCSEITNKPNELKPYNYNPLNPGEVGSRWRYLGFYNSAVWFRYSNWVYNGFDAFNISFNDSSWEVVDSTKREIVEGIKTNIDNKTYITRAFINTRVSSQPRKEVPRWLYWYVDDSIDSMG
jgi:hypothetical protein